MINKYKIIKEVINKNLAKFCFDYLKIKKNAVEFMYKKNIVNQNELLGIWTDPQIPNTYSCYSDYVMENLLIEILPIVEKQINCKLFPTYSYTRLYKKGDELKRHKDRPSCEISGTLNLGGDPWDIYLDPSGKANQKGIKIFLEPGDMLIYYGHELEHWREPFKGEECGQVFLHYTTKSTFLFDRRPMLGLPHFIKK